MNTFSSKALPKKLRSKKEDNGFTLIELMVVVAIVGILPAVGVPQLLKAQDKAKDSAAIATLTNAAKECSLLLVTEGNGDSFEIENYKTTNQDVTGTCAVDTADALQIVSEASEAQTASVSFDAGGIPSPATFPPDSTGGDSSTNPGGDGTTNP